MTREQQDKENLDCINAFESIRPKKNEMLDTLGTQLYSCQAWVYEVESIKVLRSYNTFVAVIKNGICYDFLRLVYGYSSTSAKHIRKFMACYNVTIKSTYRP